MENNVIIQLTIKKSDWLDEESLKEAIVKAVTWRLATGGCELVEARIVQQA